MPNRIIKESVCSSETIDQMSWFEECFFHRLWVNCDDYGRMDARLAILKAKLFPLKDRLSLKDIEGALVKLADIGCVRLYSCDSKPYLYLPSWEVHQNVRAKKSKYPPPDDNNASESNCTQMYADESKCPRNPIQSVSVSLSESESNARASAFDVFWDAYPNKVGKEAAKKSFSKVKVELSVLLEALDKQKRSERWTKENGQYIPNPTTWLNQGRWEDELPERRGANARSDSAENQWSGLNITKLG